VLAHIGDLTGLVVLEARQKHPSARHVPEQTRGDKPNHRLAHRRPADPEALCDLDLRDPVVWAQFALVYETHEMGLNVEAQGSVEHECHW
jgi:hypothetical protein